MGCLNTYADMPIWASASTFAGRLSLHMPGRDQCSLSSLCYHCKPILHQLKHPLNIWKTRQKTPRDNLNNEAGGTGACMGVIAAGVAVYFMEAHKIIKKAFHRCGLDVRSLCRDPQT